MEWGDAHSSTFVIFVARSTDSSSFDARLIAELVKRKINVSVMTRSHINEDEIKMPDCKGGILVMDPSEEQDLRFME